MHVKPLDDLLESLGVKCHFTVGLKFCPLVIEFLFKLIFTLVQRFSQVFDCLCLQYLLLAHFGYLTMQVLNFLSFRKPLTLLGMEFVVASLVHTKTISYIVYKPLPLVSC